VAIANRACDAFHQFWRRKCTSGIVHQNNRVRARGCDQRGGHRVLPGNTTVDYDEVHAGRDFRREGRAHQRCHSRWSGHYDAAHAGRLPEPADGVHQE
jgi:hypothetical protein